MHERTAGAAIPGHCAVIGDAQPTAQTLHLRGGVVSESYHTFAVHPDGELVRDRDGVLLRHPAFGDGTVPANSAHPPPPLDASALGASAAQPLPQQHGALARTADAIGQEFLHARLAVHEIIARPDLLTHPAELAKLVTGTHRDLFAAAVARLTHRDPPTTRCCAPSPAPGAAACPSATAPGH